MPDSHALHAPDPGLVAISHAVRVAQENARKESFPSIVTTLVVVPGSLLLGALVTWIFAVSDMTNGHHGTHSHAYYSRVPPDPTWFVQYLVLGALLLVLGVSITERKARNARLTSQFVAAGVLASCAVLFGSTGLLSGAPRVALVLGTLLVWTFMLLIGSDPLPEGNSVTLSPSTAICQNFYIAVRENLGWGDAWGEPDHTLLRQAATWLHDHVQTDSRPGGRDPMASMDPYEASSLRHLLVTRLDLATYEDGVLTITPAGRELVRKTHHSITSVL